MKMRDARRYGWAPKAKTNDMAVMAALIAVGALPWIISLHF